jgi:hypothetical protein
MTTDDNDEVTKKTEVRFGDRTTVAGTKESSLDQVFDAKTVVRITKPAPPAEPAPPTTEAKWRPLAEAAPTFEIERRSSVSQEEITAPNFDAPRWTPPAENKVVAPQPLATSISAPVPVAPASAAAVSNQLEDMSFPTSDSTPEISVAKTREAKKIKKNGRAKPKKTLDIDDESAVSPTTKRDSSHLWLAGGMTAIALVALMVLLLHGPTKATSDRNSTSVSQAQESLSSEAPVPTAPVQQPAAQIQPKVRGEQDVLKEFEQSFQQTRSQSF